MREPSGKILASPAALRPLGLAFALPGAVVLPFVCWQSLWAGAVWAAAWLALEIWALRRVAGTQICWDEQSITLTAGSRFYVRRCLPRAALTGVERLSGPLLRRTGCCVVVLHAPGIGAVAFGLAVPDAERLCALLRGNDE